MTTQELISIARTWQEFGLKPDFEKDWSVNTLFQYVGKGDKIATLKNTDGGTIFDLPREGSGYERIFGVTQVKTDRSLPHWHAYNETTLLGLDPKKSYFLHNAPRDFSQVHINVLPDGVSVTESRVTENAALFRLARMDTSHEIDLLSETHLVRTGIVHKGKELPRQRGATFQKTEGSISGIHKSAIDVHPPWQGINGDTFGEWTFSLPDSSRIRLEFDIGLQDGSENSDGVTFIVSVQDKEIFREHYNQQRWKHINLDLTPYHGQRVKLRFTINPGPNRNTGWDWARWGEPKIISEPSDTLAEVEFFLPKEPIKRFPDTVHGVGKGQYVLNTKLPAQILFFFESGTEVDSPYNLRDADFVAGLQFDGIFRRGSVWNSGQKMELILDGVSKKTIFAHPPEGQTVLQFLLSLPQAREVIFSFSMGLQDGCSDGVFFKVLVNGETQSGHFADTFRWEDANISFSEFAGETVLLELMTDSGETSFCDWAHWGDLFIAAKGVESSADVNQDGVVNALDIILIAENLGQKPPANPRIDVNKDGQVDALDLIFVAERLGEQIAAAPSQMDIIKVTPSSSGDIIVVRRALNELEAVPDKSQNVEMTIQFLHAWLANANQSVTETKLLPNYPNPFNPETWLPYQLAEATDVKVKIYDIGGRLVRTVSVGFKPVGYYLTRERAAYWDGRNEVGELVSSGIYFIQFVAGDFTTTQRMVIVK